jgi:hypothetical protein
VSRGSIPLSTETARTASDIAFRNGGDAQRRRDAAEAERLPDPGDGGLRRRACELHVAAEKAFRVEAAEHEVGVGHGRRGAAAAVAGRARIGAGAHRTDMQGAAVVAPGKRAAAGADLDDVDHRQLHGLAGELVADHIALLDRRNAAADQRAFGRGPAHVEADRALDTQQLGQSPGPNHAGDRARFHHRHRLAPRLRDRHGAPVRTHDRDPAGKARLLREAFEAPEVAGNARTDEGVEHRRGGALVFPEFAQDLVAQRHEQRGEMASQHGADRGFVRGVRIRMKKADRNRLDPERDEPPSQNFDRRRIDRDQHFARGVHSLGDLEGQFPRHQRPRAMEEQIERIGPVAASDGVDVAETCGRDQRGLGATLLEHGIDGDGGAVEKLIDGRDIATGQAQRKRGAFGRIGGHSRALRRDDRAMLIADEVGEGAADVDPDDAQDALVRIALEQTGRCRSPSPPERRRGFRAP